MARKSRPPPFQRHECEGCGQEFPRASAKPSCPSCGWRPRAEPSDEIPDEIHEAVRLTMR
jgi:rRNA maturation endonuclease Nob1